MINYNPDVLSCLANLSNDEVFTPPEIANRMLDLLPKEIWSDSKVKFLDPFCKSGVFLREITKRLLDGLSEEIPDMQERLDHILHYQVYGMAITELTSLVSRRSLYCSKEASSEYSISRFDEAAGNIAFHEIPHTWNESTGKCIYCGASREVYERGEDKESHAYQFIHTDNPKELFNNMKFDVIIGNPPYQLNDGGGRDSAAIPLYDKFVQKAKQLAPHFLIMIIPARWYTGGRGLDDFRDNMISDTRLKVIHDYPETDDCFPGLNIRGGVCYFLWDSLYHGDCTIINHIKGKMIEMKRPLKEANIPLLIRYNQSISIMKKVLKFKEVSLGKYVSTSKPFGMRSNFSDFTSIQTEMHSVKLYRFGENGYVAKKIIVKNEKLIDRYKVLVSKASPGGDEYPHSIVSQPIVSEPNSVCTETYLVIKDVDSRIEAENLVSYIKTRFFRFMMSLVKNTQNISKASYTFVPLQDFSHPWTDEMLYRKYKLSSDEIAFIESMIRPME
ncbi:Eco57I restriction-modification methylase domain-containing protein [Segatella copri]|uniref:site-specific DNA-methyltransferase (adenine-specific) n=1 Tax=Segatella copri DSM 18205 TaxID=537011 RepID=D1PH93_9BACT|nr:Eco57I restriction-modification methylase domain-containing protein [Segatella copri]EFB33942.1 Eco57I restriction endonuclease [Segatella copri DSM 18205]MCW4095932.1 Eco57I restriction-modification methylase domain-containing protein [Segatella copri]MQP20448.1 restriction endonuclease [Segatella copri DSM 18205]UEA41986.1 Eco57I restriction-modification methylase domain-containing protein [Segatella copri DSM 18205]UWP53404.1 Eco57I restriction-modification methylase domain-containing pr